jgi:hypothetical protein
MQIFTKYHYQALDEIQSYSIELTDNICICKTDNNDNMSFVLNWDGESLEGDLPEILRNEIALLINNIIQNALIAGLFLN